MNQEFEPRNTPEEQPQPTAKREEKPSDDLFYWLSAVTTALVCLVLVFTFLGRLTRVDGESMENTLVDGQLLLVWSLGYEPQQGDIVVLNKTMAEHLNGVAIVKRVIAVGGQTVDIDYATNTVYVDCEVLDEPYINEPTYMEEGTEFPLTVPEGCIFVMGDNRNHSSDSRDSRLGTVDTRCVLGKAVFLAFPGADDVTGKREFGRIGLIDGVDA